MKHVLTPGEAAALPQRFPAPEADARTAELEANRAWEIDRVEALERSEIRAWRIAVAGTAFGLIGMAAVFAQGPLRRIVEIPIVVDKVTGEATVQQRLDVETVPAMDALDKHNLATFVRAREGYSWNFLQRDFDQVARMSVPEVFSAYNLQFDGADALQKKLAGTEEWRINVIGVRLDAVRRTGNEGQATVTFDKVVRQSGRNLPEVVSRHVATVQFQYQPKVLAKEKDRLENPFGFVVTAYRSDPEINTQQAEAKP
ncbi:MAG TPA: type IV secretion system protein [Roseateles sp.]